MTSPPWLLEPHSTVLHHHLLTECMDLVVLRRHHLNMEGNMAGMNHRCNIDQALAYSAVAIDPRVSMGEAYVHVAWKFWVKKSSKPN
jgi:hypothetical protein